jgi:NADH:ubiquinone oxidoreductase subunit K
MMLEHVLFKSAYLFCIYVLITSRNMIKALMCLELVLKLILSSICFEVKRFHCDFLVFYKTTDFLVFYCELQNIFHFPLFGWQ